MDSVTFFVDENLEQIATPELDWETTDLVLQLLGENAQDAEGYLYASFEGEPVKYAGRDPFYQSIVLAYAEHRPLVLTPDMIWLKIVQALGRYISDNPEKYRELLVKHQGVKDLIVDVGYSADDPMGRWRAFAQECISLISQHVTDKFVPLLDTRFTTTGFEEMTALNITIAGMLKSYFRVVRRRCVCGIPKITLKGTTEDWLAIYAKLDSIDSLGFDTADDSDRIRKWVKDLRQIIQQFIDASKGNADRKFWQRILVSERQDEFTEGRCIKEPSKIDGWILRFYDLDSNAPLQFTQYGRHMKSELAVFPFLTETLDGTHCQVDIMQLWAGFVGLTEDPVTFEVTPKIGWMLVKE